MILMVIFSIKLVSVASVCVTPASGTPQAQGYCSDLSAKNLFDLYTDQGLTPGGIVKYQVRKYRHGTMILLLNVQIIVRLLSLASFLITIVKQVIVLPILEKLLLRAMLPINFSLKMVIFLRFYRQKNKYFPCNMI